MVVGVTVAVGISRIRWVCAFLPRAPGCRPLPILSAATGWDYDKEEAMRFGRRPRR